MRIEFDEHEHEIAGYWLSALFNGDYSGLNDKEIAQFEDWEATAQSVGRGFWAGYREDSRTECGVDEVTGLRADTYVVVYHVQQEGLPT